MHSDKFKTIGALTLSAFLVSSCGGSSSGDHSDLAIASALDGLRTGVFVDSPVAGLNYVTPTVSGVTDADGVFQFREGEAIVFKVGQLALPLAATSEIVTPLDMVSTDDVNDPSVVNIVRLLQSLDDDRDPSNGIVIAQSTADKFSEAELYDTTDSDAVDVLVERAFAGEKEPVTAVAAVSHFVDTLSSLSESNTDLLQWQYLVNENSTFAGDTLYVSDDNFSLTLNGETFTGATSINQGVYKLRGDSDSWFVSVSSTDDIKVACVAAYPKPVSECDGNLFRVFEEEQQAMLFNKEAAESAEESAEIVLPGTNAAVDVSSEGEQELEPSAPIVDGQDSNIASAASQEALPVENSAANSSPDELTFEQLFDPCPTGTQDEDRDGFGWFNQKTCLISAATDAFNVDQQVEIPSGSATLVESASEVESGPVVESAPAVESVPVEESPPAVESVPVEESAPVEESVPVVESAPAVENVPVEESAPAVDSVPVVESAPAVENVPVVESAPVVESVPVVESAPVENAPVLESTPVAETTPVVESVIDETVTTSVVVDAPVGFLPEDITDLILLTGQSNAAAFQTAFDATLDAGHERVFAYTEEGAWQPADLHQNWDGDTPGNFSDEVAGRNPYNNLVFQVGKSLAQKSDRVVGIVLIAAPGKGISHWDYDSEFYRQLRTTATSALAALPQKSSIDAMLWVHGETDWLKEGTADPFATGYASVESDFYRDYYPNKLRQLISNLRSEWWYGSTARFICSETKKADLNEHLMALNDDGDERTSCAQASDLPTRSDDPFDNHFSAQGLRTLGARIADLYLIE